jgi:hypothetical protein
MGSSAALCWRRQVPSCSSCSKYHFPYISLPHFLKNSNSQLEIGTNPAQPMKIRTDIGHYRHSRVTGSQVSASHRTPRNGREEGTEDEER